MLLFLFWVPFLVLGLVVCRFTSLFCTTLDVVFVGSNVSVLEVPFLNLDGSNVRPIEKHASSLSPPPLFFDHMLVCYLHHISSPVYKISVFVFQSESAQYHYQCVEAVSMNQYHNMVPCCYTFEGLRF